MNRQHLIKHLAQNSGLTQAQSKRALAALEQTIARALYEGESVYLPPLGVFEVRHHLPRTGRNPLTGAPVEIPLKTVPAFKPSAPLKQAVAQQN
ncbi:HU family DNA-binding protein [Ferrimonas balearica]|uniref:HU family DNA-binding protein n=1 Tax=Ferrimonas balearica TaxID=44012 RepID=UPI001C99E4D9|nr:HU family DNA-binding protein [Ferrimonas balearica]MBY5991106.1 HU family DNA-binding protein [Ferrimonas balearica]